jgi:DNA-binding Lrp family transcriptional regulator
MEGNPMSVRDIVVALQRGIPVEPRPFAALARDLGTEEDAVLGVARRMLDDGTARRFGAVFDARRLGYRSELCAMDVPPERLDATGAAVAAHSGVTHCYLRGHPPGLPPFSDVAGLGPVPNLWFTLAVLRDRFEAEACRLLASVAPLAIRRFPATRRFKIDAIFDPMELNAGERAPGMAAGNGFAPDETPVALTDSDRALIRTLGGDLPPHADFYGRLAGSVGWPPDALLDRLRAWRQSGVLRRMALVVRHRRIGFAANAMCVWVAGAGDLVRAGRRLAAWPAVTHCYERVTGEGWPFNLYAMIHTGEWPATQALFERLSADAGLPGGLMLGSLREYKKDSMRYFGEDRA